jgi:hypothetical protein
MTLRLQTHIADALSEAAANLGLSQATFIRHCILAGLEHERRQQLLNHGKGEA